MTPIPPDLLELARRQGIDREAVREHLREAQEEDAACEARRQAADARLLTQYAASLDEQCGEGRR